MKTTAFFNANVEVGEISCNVKRVNSCFLKPEEKRIREKGLVGDFVDAIFGLAYDQGSIQSSISTFAIERGSVLLSAPRDDSTALTSDEADRWLSSTRLISRAQLPMLLEEHRPLLKRIAEKEVPAYLLPRFDSSDVVQETLLKAFHNFEQFAGRTDAEFVSWMRGILLNQIVDTIRHHGRQIRDMARARSMPPELECEKSLTASDLVQKQELSDRLMRALNAMPEDYRTVLLLRQEQNLGFPEIGVRMQRSTDAARMLWGRAVVMLAKVMQSHDATV